MYMYSVVQMRLLLPGNSMVNRIPNCSLLTNKLGLINSLRQYERSGYYSDLANNRISSKDFLPETFRIDSMDDREAFVRAFQREPLN